MNADLNDLKDIHEGCKCYVVGAGPSLAFADISPIHDHVVIAVNSAAMLMPWSKPGDNSRRYWVSNDSLVIKWSYFKNHVEPAHCTKLIRVSWAKHARFIRGKHYRYFFPRETKHNAPLNPEDRGLCGVSSVPTAIDLGLLLGAKQIYLLGVDHKIVQNKSHFWQFWHKSKWPQRVDKSRNFRPEQKHQKEMFEKNLAAFSRLNDYAEGRGTQIFTLSSGSAVKVFPKTSLKESLS